MSGKKASPASVIASVSLGVIFLKLHLEKNITNIQIIFKKKSDIPNVELKLKFQSIQAVNCGNQRKACGVIKNTSSGNPLEKKTEIYTEILLTSFFSFHFLPSLEVRYCKNMPSISLFFIFGPKSTVQASSSKITVMFRVQIFYPLFYILCFVTEGLTAHKQYRLSAEALLIHINA